MQRKNLLIQNKLGLHARAAAKLVTLATRFAAHIEIHRGKQIANAKSIMGVMMLGVARDTKITLVTEGEDEELALSSLEELIDNKFGEGE